MASEKITYLVTNYNNAAYVGECLQSIIDQQNPNWYCLITDDASTDNSVEVINKYTSDKLKLIQNEVNLDQVRSIIKLMELAETDIVCIVDSDDALELDATDYVINAFSKSPRIGFVYTNCIEYDEDLKIPLAIGLSQRIPFGPTSSVVFGHVGHMRCFRKSTYAKTSGYDASLLYAEDLDLGYKLEEVCLPYFVNRFVYRHRRLRETRGKKDYNKLLGYRNRKLAKIRAIKRRGVKFPLKLVYMFYICAEYRKCSCSKTGKKFRKRIYEILLDKVGRIINIIEFKPVKGIAGPGMKRHGQG